MINEKHTKDKSLKLKDKKGSIRVIWSTIVILSMISTGCTDFTEIVSVRADENHGENHGEDHGGGQVVNHDHMHCTSFAQGVYNVIRCEDLRTICYLYGSDIHCLNKRLGRDCPDEADTQ